MVQKRKSFVAIGSVFLIGFLLLTLPFSSAYEISLTYDGNGNLITGDGKYREYNEFNQLTRVREGNSSSGRTLEEYLYHPTEDRILIKYGYNITNDVDGAVLYINDNFVREYSNLGGTPRVNDTYYLRDEQGIVAEVIRNVSYQGNYSAVLSMLYHHNDHLGSTSVITNQSGAVVEQTFYEPFGGIISGGNISRYDYEGREFTELTGDYDFRFRKYDPELKIFTQPDAGVNNVYDPQELNRYAFEKNNPYKYVDEDGKIAILAVVAIGAGIGLAAYFVQHALTDKQYTWHGALAYTVAGALAPLGAEAVLFLGEASGIGTTGYSGLALTGAAGASESAIFQVGQNIGEERPLGSDLRQAVVFGVITSTGRKILLPSTKEWLLKKFSSTFTTGTGQKYFTNTLIQSGADFSLNYVCDLAKQTSSESSSSGGGVTTYCLNGQCYSGVQPKDTYDSVNGVYIDQNGNGYSVSPDNVDKMRKKGG